MWFTFESDQQSALALSSTKLSPADAIHSGVPCHEDAMSEQGLCHEQTPSDENPDERTVSENGKDFGMNSALTT